MAVALCAIAAVYAALAYMVPPHVDEIRFAGEYLRLAPGRSGFDFGAWADYVTVQRDTDNSRLPNLLAPLLLLMVPRIVPAAFIGLCVAAMILLIAAMSRPKGCPGWKGIAVVWAAAVLFLPWRDRLFVVSYSLNYIVGAVIGLAFLYSVKRAPGGVASIVAVALAAVASLWHEGLAVTLIAALAVKAALGRGHVSAAVYVSMGVLALGAAAVICCPGTLGRIDREVLHMRGVRELVLGGVDNCLVLALCVAFAFRSVRQRLYESGCLPVAVAAVTGMMVSFAVNYEGRTAFWPQTCALVCWGSVLYPSFVRFGPTVCRGTAVGCMTLCAVHGALTIYWQACLWEQYKTVTAKLEAAPSRQVFHDLIGPWQIPAVTLYFPVYDTFRNEFNDWALHTYVWAGTRPAVVPTALDCNLAAEPGKPLSGNLGAFVKDGAIYMPAPADAGSKSGKRLLRYSDDEGGGGTYTFYYTTFTDANGDTYMYLAPRMRSRHNIVSLSELL